MATAVCWSLALSALILACPGADVGQIWEARWVIVVAVVASAFAVRSDRNSHEIDSASGFIPIVIAATAFSPIAALVTAIFSALPHLVRHPGGAAWFGRCAATRSFSGVTVAVLYAGLNISDDQVQMIIFAVFAVSGVYQVFQLLCTTLVLSYQLGGDPLRRLRVLSVQFALAAMVFGPLSAAFSYLLRLEPQVILLAAFAASFSHHMLVTVVQSGAITRLLGDMYVEVPGALLAALDAADHYTARHSASVASYCFDISQQLGHAPQTSQIIHAAALLHDIGKIGVPDDVLAKPERLDADEWEMMKQHPVTGASIVRHLPGFHRLELGILHHHERIDGSGYPSGLSGSDIPLESQIIAVADTYSAMTTSRPYRDPKDPNVAIKELKGDVHRGLLNKTVAEAFVSVLHRSGDDYRHGRHTTLRDEVERLRGWLDVQRHVRIATLEHPNNDANFSIREP